MAIEEPIEAKEVERISPKTTEKYKVRIENVTVWYGSKKAIKDINLNVRDKSVTAFIGPSGCGKTTLLRCLNRMHELTPGARAEGKVIVDGIDIYDKSIDPVIIRRRVGMARSSCSRRTP